MDSYLETHPFAAVGCTAAPSPTPDPKESAEDLDVSPFKEVPLYSVGDDIVLISCGYRGKVTGIFYEGTEPRYAVLFTTHNSPPWDIVVSGEVLRKVDTDAPPVTIVAQEALEVAFLAAVLVTEVSSLPPFWQSIETQPESREELFASVIEARNSALTSASYLQAWLEKYCADRSSINTWAQLTQVTKPSSWGLRKNIGSSTGT